MRVSDLLVIYFSLGAPVAVYFYLQTRASSNRKKIRRETVFTFLFWIPQALRVISKTRVFQNRVSSKRANEIFPPAEREENLQLLQKRLENVLPEGNCGLTVFEFRETIERYAGLTLAARIENGAAGKDFFVAAQNKNIELAAECFNRRNRRRLLFHQTSARRDFLQILARMSETVADREELGSLSVEFTGILKDSEAGKSVEELFFTAPPQGGQSTAKILEKDLWKPETNRRPQRQTAAS